MTPLRDTALNFSFFWSLQFRCTSWQRGYKDLWVQCGQSSNPGGPEVQLDVPLFDSMTGADVTTGRLSKLGQASSCISTAISAAWGVACKPVALLQAWFW